MTIKSAQTLVAEALKEIKTINTDEAFKMLEENDCNLIDIRDVRELEKEGRVENSNHIPRGMLEFWLDPNSPYFQQGKLNKDKEMVLENIYSNIDSDPNIDVELDDVSYKLWALTDKQILNQLINCLSDKSLVIADGHHRYKTALKYAKQNKNLMESQKVMVTLVNSNNPGMQIMPTHRLLTSINMDIKAIKERLNECFDVNEFLDLNTLLQELESSRNKNGKVGCVPSVVF